MKREAVTEDTISEFQIGAVQRALRSSPVKSVLHRNVLQDCELALRGSRSCRTSIADAYNEMIGAGPLAGQLTGDTVTDIQIIDLLARLLNDVHAHMHQQLDMRLCKIAIGHIRKSKIERAAARAYCAELLNREAAEA
jgi:hypothetical protein